MSVQRREPEHGTSKNRRATYSTLPEDLDPRSSCRVGPTGLAKRGRSYASENNTVNAHLGGRGASLRAGVCSARPNARQGATWQHGTSHTAVCCDLCHVSPRASGYAYRRILWTLMHHSRSDLSRGALHCAVAARPFASARWSLSVRPQRAELASRLSAPSATTGGSRAQRRVSAGG
jgi:hypothetical protein